MNANMMKKKATELKAMAEAMKVYTEGMSKAEMVNAINEATAKAEAKAKATTEEPKAEATEAEDAIFVLMEAKGRTAIEMQSKFEPLTEGNFDRIGVDGTTVNNYNAYIAKVDNLKKHVYAYMYNGGKMEGKIVTETTIKTCFEAVLKEMGMNHQHTTALAVAFGDGHIVPCNKDGRQKTTVQKAKERKVQKELKAIEATEPKDKEGKERKEEALKAKEEELNNLRMNAKYEEEAVNEKGKAKYKEMLELWIAYTICGGRWAKEALSAITEGANGKMRRAVNKAVLLGIDEAIIVECFVKGDVEKLRKLNAETEAKQNAETEAKAK